MQKLVENYAFHRITSSQSEWFKLMPMLLLCLFLGWLAFGVAVGLRIILKWLIGFLWRSLFECRVSNELSQSGSLGSHATWSEILILIWLFCPYKMKLQMTFKVHTYYAFYLLIFLLGSVFNYLSVSYDFRMLFSVLFRMVNDYLKIRREWLYRENRLPKSWTKSHDFIKFYVSWIHD